MTLTRTAAATASALVTVALLAGCNKTDSSDAMSPSPAMSDAMGHDAMSPSPAMSDAMMEDN